MKNAVRVAAGDTARTFHDLEPAGARISAHDAELMDVTAHDAELMDMTAHDAELMDTTAHRRRINGHDGASTNLQRYDAE